MILISSPQLKGEMKKQLDIRGWGYKELAKQTGYSEATVRVYMSDTQKQSEHFEICARRVLGISEV